MDIECRVCHKEQDESCFFRASNRQYVDKICKACKHAAMQERRQALKREMVERMGGKCQRCGYDKCIASLEFHHMDPSKKEMTFKRANLASKERVLKELKICVLLCANCHQEVHYTNDEEYLICSATS